MRIILRYLLSMAIKPVLLNWIAALPAIIVIS